MDRFNTKWGKALEKTLVSVPCTGEYNGSVSRYCGDGGNWDDPDYSQCTLKSIEYLQNQVKRSDTFGHVSHYLFSNNTTLDFRSVFF